MKIYRQRTFLYVFEDFKGDESFKVINLYEDMNEANLYYNVYSEKIYISFNLVELDNLIKNKNKDKDLIMVILLSDGIYDDDFFDGNFNK